MWLCISTEARRWCVALVPVIHWGLARARLTTRLCVLGRALFAERAIPTVSMAASGMRTARVHTTCTARLAVEVLACVWLSLAACGASVAANGGCPTRKMVVVYTNATTYYSLISKDVRIA